MIFDKLFNKGKTAVDGKTVMRSTNVDYYVEGIAQFNAGHFTQAMEYFQAALNKDPENEDVLRGLADTYGRLGKTGLQKETLAKIKNDRPTPLQPPLPSDNDEPSKTKRRDNVLSQVGIFLNKTTKHIKKDDLWCYVFRIVLYCITVFNVIQLLSASLNVINWTVWDGLLILPGIGVIGVGVCIILPAYCVGLLMAKIEMTPSINLKKTNIVLIILNVSSFSNASIIASFTSYASATVAEPKTVKSLF